MIFSPPLFHAKTQRREEAKTQRKQEILCGFCFYLAHNEPVELCVKMIAHKINYDI